MKKLLILPVLAVTLMAIQTPAEAFGEKMCSGQEDQLKPIAPQPHYAIDCAKH